MPEKWNRVKAILAEKEGIDFQDNNQAVNQIFKILTDLYGEKLAIENV